MLRPSSTTASQFHKSKTLNDKYLLGDEIGKGAYGRVYKGVDLENGDFVAIKQVSLENIPPEDLASIMQEIDLLKNLNHKNIVKYQGSSKTKTHLYIILEYVENGSLASLLKPNKFGAFPESLVAVYIAQVLEGLAYLHEQGVIHRDIKGANILTTKEGFVKLADFGVATKLTEADINTHSVVGTPYWMAPEVIEMSGVSASSDIWSVGCTVIELLTTVPPYYDLQPMPALFRIVQDERPPIPEHLSSGLTDFLHQCFQKDAKLRPDAKTLLKHSWIRNSRRALPFGTAGPISNIPKGVSTVLERLEDSQKEDQQSLQQDQAEQTQNDAREQGASDGAGAIDTNGARKTADLPVEKVAESGDQSESAPAAEEVPSLSNVGNASVPIQDHVGAQKVTEESFTPERLKSPVAEVEENIVKEGYTVSTTQSNGSDTIQSGRTPRLAAQALGRFKDTPADGNLDDLFEDYNYKKEASEDVGLSKKLSDKMTRTSDDGRNGEELFRKIVDAVQGEDFDSGLGFDTNVESRDYYAKQAVEVRRLFGLLKPEEPEDVVLSTCQKLALIFREFPDQKTHLISQHGLMPLVEMLEVNNNRITHAVLVLINQIIKDSTDVQENACLVGLVPAVMSFAAPERSKEIRMQAALFVEQMCNSSASTLQMFVACRGLPVLVGFLEPDYAKYREMVHLAIDCMWQVFELKSPTPRNDFCRIFAKSGVLVRLVNTLHSMNEATRLACAGSGNSSTGVETKSHRSRSGPLEPSRVVAEHYRPKSGQLDPLRVRYAQAQVPDSPRFQLSSDHADVKPFDLPGHPRRRSMSQEKLVLHTAENSGRVEKASQTDTQQDAQVDSGVFRPLLASKAEPFADQSWTNGFNAPEQLPPLLTMLEKEPPSRPISGQLNYVRSGTENYLPLLHHSSATRRNNGDLEMLMSAFAEKGDIRALGIQEGSSSKAANNLKHLANGLATASNTSEVTASTSGLVSQSASGLLSLSGVLNGRPASATSSGALTRLSSTFNAEVAKEYLVKVAELLYEFSLADTSVKSSMCSLSLLIRLFTMLSKLEGPILLKILKCINQLSMDPYTLEPLQRADAMKHLVPLLRERQDGQLGPHIHYQVLNALYNLCKINKRRQEQAAECGIIAHLMQFINMNSPLKKFALPLLCDMAHASRYTREQLRVNRGLDVYLDLLDDEYWAVIALDSLAVCLAHDNEHRKVEQALLKKESVMKLVAFFQSCNGPSFIHILEPFLKIITKSPRLNTALAVSGLTQYLVGRLDHQDAIARLNLLKLIKAVYEHHPRPKQLIVEHDLPSKLQRLIEERRDGERSGGQVLVKQMATALLKALHINTVI